MNHNSSQDCLKKILWACWFLGKNLSNFVSPIGKLHNPYCHTIYTTHCSGLKWSEAIIFGNCVFTKYLLAWQEGLKSKIKTPTPIRILINKGFQSIVLWKWAKVCCRHQSRPCGFGQSLGRPIVRSCSDFFGRPKKIVQSQRIFGQSLGIFGRPNFFLVYKNFFWLIRFFLVDQKN